MEMWLELDENNEERRSFDDSDRFEEDSLCSWVSEPESICGNWRGWKRTSQNGVQNLDTDLEENVESLIEICSRTVAKHIPFETVENTYPQIPEQLQVRIAFWSFPPVEDDIRLYSCLANGSPDKFNEGEQLLKVQAVKDVLQMGFHLSATVHQPHSICQSKGTFNVAVTFDRGHITSCNCTCDQSATWCAHVIALCLFRIQFANLVCLRAPVSEYLSRLKRNQLQKFAQYLISELPQQLLPTAQRLLDELLSSQESAINSVSGAPDPTAGPSAVDQSKWCLDEGSLHDNIKKMLVRFCGPSPLVFSDVNALYLANTAPPTAAEWSNLLRPLRGREPEGMWNLLSIVRELFHRGDLNAVNLLVILTEECLANDMVLIWWFDSRSQASGNASSHSHGNGYRGNTNVPSTEATKHACAGFCDELVTLWRLAVLNPKLTDEERQEIKPQLDIWHKKAVEKGRAGRGAIHLNLSAAVSCFPGFLPAIEACSLNWKNVDLSVVPDVKLPARVPLTLPCARTPVPSLSRDVESGVDETSQEGLLPLELSSFTESEANNKEQTNNTLADGQVHTLVPLQDIDEDLEVLCARTEALHVHGYSSLAAKLAIRLADSILSDSARAGVSCASGARSKNRASPGTTSFTSTILVKAAFLCNVLAEDPHCHHLAFRVGMLGLEMPRQPAKSKALQVKLANQESELVVLLKKLPPGPAEVAVVREKAELLRQGQLRRGEAVLPIMLATFIFDVLCSSQGLSHAKRLVTGKMCEATKEDEELGFQAALCALGMKGNVLETQHPMLCEGTRRQRGDLALALLLHCRDDSSRIRQIMDVLLDKSRYDVIPSSVGENQANQKSSSEEGNHGNSEACASGEVKTRGGLAVPDRKSNTPSLSSTSDSGTDSSKDSSGTEKCKPRVRFTRPPPSRLTATVTEVSLDDESGSSSGVDTDLVPVLRNAEAHEGSQLSVRVTQVIQPGLWQGLPDGPAFDGASDVPCVLDPVVDVLNCPPVYDPHTDSYGEAKVGTIHEGPSRVGTTAKGALHVDPSSPSSPDEPMIKRVEIPDKQRFSSEGDVSDIEADFEEANDEADSGPSANGASVLPVFRSGTIAGLESAAPSTSRGAEHQDNGPQGSLNAGAQGYGAMSVRAPDDADPAEDDGASAAALVESVEEATEEQSSESGARGSASPSADDGDRSRRRNRHRGRRRRRGAKSAFYQATEAEAHFMFELAKTVLGKAGGSSSTSVFCTQPTNSETQSGPHKVLLLCAFEIGLFALGLHNRTSPNWLSRTYSSHVSWITERAMDIGHQAIALLLERWDGNLTPSEVASIADRASNSNDRAMVRAAAELGLSCLHMAHTLNPVEIKRALSQCREEDSQLLDQACQAVESAARGGGVYPEVLFDVAKQWFHLHEQSQQSSSTSRTAKSESRARSSQNRSSSQPPSSSHSPPLSPFMPPVPQFNVPPSYSSMPHLLYATPEQYVQQQMHQQVHQMMGHYPAYLSGASSGYRPGSQAHFSYPFSRSLTGTQFSLSGAYAGLPPPPFQSSSGVGANPNQHLSRVTTAQQGTHVSYYLNSAYRVGMLALEFLSRRTSDDRPSVKFSRNPNCSEDIRWLCNLSAKALGTSHLQRFCVAALNAVVSPFVLHDLALEAARHMARSNPAQLAANLRSPTISPLVQKSLTMYAQCIHYHLINITQAEYDEFVELLRHARGAFCMAPGGMTQFNELLQSIRWGYAKKKELWQMIMTGLAKA